VESKQNFFRLGGFNVNYPSIKLLKLELKKLKLDLNLNGDQQQYVTEIVIEINEIKKFSFYISIFQDPCNEQAWTNEYNTNNAIIGENGKKQMTIERNYSDYYTDGILICGLNDRIGEVILKLKKEKLCICVCNWIFGFLLIHRNYNDILVRGLHHRFTASQTL